MRYDWLWAPQERQRVNGSARARFTHESKERAHLKEHSSCDRQNLLIFLSVTLFFVSKRRFMNLKVKILADKEEEKRLEISNADTYETVLEKLAINPEEVLVLRSGKPVPEDEPVADSTDPGSEITIIRIISVG